MTPEDNNTPLQPTVPEHDPAFDDLQKEEASGNGAHPGTSDQEDLFKGGGNMITRFLYALGYYDPLRRKTAVMIVAMITTVLLLLLLGLSGKHREKVTLEGASESPDAATAQANLSFTADELSVGDDLSDESLMNLLAKRSASNPGKFASDMFATVGEEQQDLMDYDELSLTTQAQQSEEVKPVSRSEAAAQRREQARRGLGLDDSLAYIGASVNATDTRSKAAQTVESQYGISEEALRMNGMTPEEFLSMMSGYSPETPAQQALPQEGEQQPEDISALIPAGAPTIRRTGGMESLDSDNWGGMGTMSGLEDEDPFVSTDANHPFKVMFCKTEKVRSGQRVSLRLLEDMIVEDVLLPANTHLSCIISVGERLGVSVQNVDYNGRLLSLNFIGYDNDGGLGLYCPNADTSLTDELSTGTSVLSSALQSGMRGSLPSQLVSSGVSMTLSRRGEATVTLTSGYTFYLMRRTVK